MSIERKLLHRLERLIDSRSKKEIKAVDWSDSQQAYLHGILKSNWIPCQPTSKQEDFLLATDKEILFGGAAGGGKALHVDTPIPTVSGWKTMGELSVGDTVFDENGQPCRVLACSEVMLERPCYRLVFDGGESIIADADHLWVTMTNAERLQAVRCKGLWREKRRANRPSRSTGKRPDVAIKNKAKQHVYLLPPTGAVRTTAEIAATVRVLATSRTNHSIAVAKGIQCQEVELLISPYLLGLWLGDGTSAGGSITSADCDVPIAFHSAGYQVAKLSSKYGWGIHGLRRQLRQLGLLHNKHIPEQYMRASFDQRLALVRGLFDTDGDCCIDGGCEFSNTNKRLAEQALELVRSLGVRASLSVRRAKLYGKDCGPCYRVKCTPPIRFFELPRKWERQTYGCRWTSLRHYITSVEVVESVPVRCIAVSSPSRCYLASRSFIPTHNSNALLMAAAQYVEVPSYAALLLRRTYADLALPGALMDRSKEWWTNTDAKWNGQDHTWTFPSGATITFGYLESDKDKYRYASSEFQFIGFDELTTFPELPYRFLFSRLRKVATNPVPLRMRAGSNPGGIGASWVKERFLIAKVDGRRFIPSRLDDNPHLDHASYIESLAELDPLTRQRLLKGDWDATEEGRFKRDWVRYYTRRGDFYNVAGRAWMPNQLRPRFLTVDPAATVKTALKPDPDYTVVSAWGITPEGELLWLGCRRVRCEVPDIAQHVAEMYERFNADKAHIEANGPQKGVAQLARRHKLAGGRNMNVVEVIPSKDKLQQAANAMNVAEAGRLWLPTSDPTFPLEEVEAELLRFTGDDKKDAHDDLVTTVSVAADILVGRDTAQAGGKGAVPKMVPWSK